MESNQKKTVEKKGFGGIFVETLIEAFFMLLLSIIISGFIIEGIGIFVYGLVGLKMHPGFGSEQYQYILFFFWVIGMFAYQKYERQNQ